ncbi:hypothetical protein JRO89_XS11G0073600 [Xanthoceras sorbifolium]|uniref:Uncharacterized protein n=1 Tax=Xanthoceras sorbifolium TaxID=99658 RepID=A0ABQ8HEZ4_9ROSI|nr:hypothetical protein JRO89_XS11G0073600 [Xanthoceras sorbifolium]
MNFGVPCKREVEKMEEFVNGLANLKRATFRAKDIAKVALYFASDESTSGYGLLLTSLNRNLDEVRGRVVARAPFPSPEEAFTEVRQEEGHRKVMLNDDPVQPALSSAPESFALVSRNFSSHGRPVHDSRSNKRGERPWYDHCNPPGHTREKCWQLHGKPPNWQQKNLVDERAYSTHLARTQLETPHLLVETGTGQREIEASSGAS